MESRKLVEAIIKAKVISSKFDSSSGQVKHPIDTAKPRGQTAKGRGGGSLVSRSTIDR